MQHQLKWLFIGGLVVAAIGLYLGYDAALAALLAPLFGMGKHKQRAEQATTEGDVYREIAGAHVNDAQERIIEANAIHEEQERLAEDNEANENISIDEKVDDAKNDWH